MNVLVLPYNIASLSAITAEALNKIEGVHARSLTVEMHKYQMVNSSTICLPMVVSKRKPLKWVWNKITFKRKLYQQMKWADVIHYQWGTVFPDHADLKWAARSGKPIFIEWIGSEIRIPDLCKKLNPYYASVFDKGYEYYKLESNNRSLEVQKIFKSAGAIPLIFPEMSIYVKKDIFPVTYPSQVRLNISNFVPAYPSPDTKRPLIVHSPTAKICKGTDIILPVINQLKEILDFDFVLLHDMTREQVHEMMRKADIYLDQVIVGSHGMATVEAMALGKPVMCYIMKEVFEGGLPADCPIVNTNPDNLKEQLVKLITNAQLRHDVGRQSRIFAEKNFDADKISVQLVNIYKEVLEAKKNTHAKTA